MDLVDDDGDLEILHEETVRDRQSFLDCDANTLKRTLTYHTAHI